MSETTLWAIIAKPDRGGREYPLIHTIRSSRRETIAAYNEDLGDLTAQMRREGHGRVGRVAVRVLPSTEETHD